MSQLIESILRDVSLDERVSDGIFQMENESHMGALRDHLIQRGLTKEAAIHITNRMIEGKYPQRQLWQKDTGILVTWPTPQHMAKAVKENPGKYINTNPKPKAEKEDPSNEPKTAPPGSKPEPGEKPSTEEPDDENDSLPKSSAGGSIFGGSSGKSDGPKVPQGEKQLDIEPPRGTEKPAPPQPPSPTVKPAPRTPERIAAEKEVTNQIFQTDDSILTNVANPLNINEKALNHQLNELYKKADEWGFREAITFLTPYVKS